MELIREILFSIEEENPKKLSSYNEDTVKYHQALLIDAKLVEGSILPNNQISSQIPNMVIIKKLNWTGHEFLDAVRQDNVWNTIKSEFKDASIETLISVSKQLAEGWAKKKVKILLDNNEAGVD